MAAINLTADFSLFPDNTPLGQNFTLSSYIFNDLSGSGSLFVNETAGEKGAQFITDGIEVLLPFPTRIVDLRLGAFAGPIHIAATDSSGNIVRTQTLNILNQFVNIRLSASEIASVTITDGGREGILAKISATFSIC